MARPPFIPTGEQRRIVMSMSAYGISQVDIGKVLEVSVKTLIKHFQKEWELGRIQANCKVGQTLYEMATGGKCVAATIYWLKNQAGWERWNAAEIQVPPYIVGVVQKPWQP